MSYLGVPPFGQTVRTVTEVTAQQDQVTFYPTGGYIPGYIDIDTNGSGLGSADFTATDGVSVTLAVKCGAGDLFKSIAYWPVALQDTMRRAEINGIVGAGGWAMRNRLINGDMRIDQRNAGAAITNGAGSTYFVDRWLMYDGSGGSHFSVGQNKNGVASLSATGFANYLGFQTTSAVSASAANNFTLNQYIEGYNVADLQWGTVNAKPATLSFWVQSSLTGTFAGVIQEDGGTAFYVYTYTINQANTWEFKTINIPAATIGTWSTTNGRGINARWDMGMGSNFNGTAGAWSASSAYTVAGAQKVVGTLGATFYITGVQFEKGSYATPFDFRPIGTELALCQRYYVNYAGTNWALNPSGNNGQNSNPAWTFAVPMRAAPTGSNITGYVQGYTTSYTINSASLSTSATGVGYFVSTLSSNPSYSSWLMLELTTCSMSAEL